MGIKKNVSTRMIFQLKRAAEQLYRNKQAIAIGSLLFLSSDDLQTQSLTYRFPKVEFAHT